MGDLVVTTPVFRALDEQLGAEVHLATKAAFAPVVAHNPHLARVHLWRDDLWRELRAERFDLVVDLHGNLRSHLLRLRLGVPAVGFRKRNLEKSLLPRGIDLLGEEHLVDRYFRALRATGVRPDGRGLDYAVTSDERAGVRATLREAGVGGGGGGGVGFVAVVLGATHFTKRMPPELVADTVRELDRPAVLLGGPDVVELAARVTRLLRGAGVVDLCGRLPLRDSIAVLAEAAVVIAGDTGLMHVAAALRKPTVVVWGNTAPAIGMYPYLPEGAAHLRFDAEVEGLACRPCSRIGFAACPRGHFRCMREQDGGRIAAAARELTDRAGRGVG